MKDIAKHRTKTYGGSFAATVILVWFMDLSGVQPPVEVVIAINSVLALGIGWLESRGA